MCKLELAQKALALLPYLIAVNIVLSAVAAALHGLAQSAGKSDSSLVKAIGAISGFLKKILDFASANQQH